MAFQIGKSSKFHGFLKKRENFPGTLIPVAENFLLEERLSPEREDSYTRFVPAPADAGGWNSTHEDYIARRIKDNLPSLTIPTVLDAGFSPFFFPTPKEDYNQGLAVDLSPGHENDYSLNNEILHRYIEYKPEHIYRVGWINRSPGRTWQEARKIHLDLLEPDLKNYTDAFN